MAPAMPDDRLAAAAMNGTTHWASQLADRRGREVVFLSHCLLNENTRYLGGACERGASLPIVRLCLERGYGMVQMPCPEQHAWGGVLKRRLLRFFGSKATPLGRVRPAALPVLVWYTRRVCRRLARDVAAQMLDDESSGFDVVGVVGVDGSPSCGATRTIDVRRALDLVAELQPTATADDMNRIVLRSITAGRGIFVEELQAQLRRLRLDIPFFAFDLPSELAGLPRAPSLRGS